MTRRGWLAWFGPAVARAALSESRNPLVRTVAWVDGNGGAGEWQASIEGRAARVVRARGPEDPLLLLLVADLTGDLTLVDPAREALIELVGELNRDSWVALLRAQDGLQTLVDPTGERPPVIGALREMQITGRAGLLEAVEPAAALASGILRKSPLRLGILFITDSNIYNYREDYTNPVINYSDTRDLSRRFPEALIREKTAKLARSLAGAEVPLFIVHLAFLRDRMNEAYQTGLRQLAEATGGEASVCRSPAEIPASIREAFGRISNHWAIDVELPQGVPKEFNLTLSAGGAPVRHRAKFVSQRK